MRRGNQTERRKKLKCDADQRQRHERVDGGDGAGDCGDGAETAGGQSVLLLLFIFQQPGRGTVPSQSSCPETPEHLS